MREEKKMKQSIISIALILLLSSYYFTPSTIGKSQTENEEGKNNLFHHCTNPEDPQGENRCTENAIDKDGFCKYYLENPENVSQNADSRSDSLVIPAN